MPLIPKPNYNQIFASQAPEQDKPAVFNNYPLGWGVESRPNNGKPTIKGFNFLQQTSDLKDLWILQNGACLPYDESIEYAEGAPVLKDGVIQYKTLDGFKSRDSVTIPTYNSAADGIDPVTGVADGAYFNVRSSSDESYVDEYQNVGGSAVATGKSYPSSESVVKKEAILDESGTPTAEKLYDGIFSQKQVNEIKGLNIWDFFTQEEVDGYYANPNTYDMSTAIQRGIGVATLLKRKLDGYGEFYIANPTVISCACDLRDVTLNTDMTNQIAVSVRNPDYSYIYRQSFILPRVINTNYVTKDGWAANSVGIEINNVLASEITIPHAAYFHTNVRVTSTMSCCYNDFYMGHIHHGKINLDITTQPIGDARPWTNENNFFGGRFSHNNGEGEAVAGVRHIRLHSTTSSLNNNVFYKPSVEGNVPEYHLELACQHCRFIHPRLEADPPRVFYRNDGIGLNQAMYNVIDGGYNVERIAFTFTEPSATLRNTLNSQGRNLKTFSTVNGGDRYQNAASRTQPVISIFQPEAGRIETVPLSAYSMLFSPEGIKIKRWDDTSDRIFIDGYRGYITFTNGAGASEIYLRNFGSNFQFSCTAIQPAANDTTDLGTTSARFKRLLLSGGVGFFGSTPPTTKPSVTGKIAPTTIAEQNAVINSIVSALVAYGIVSDDRTA